MKNLIEENYKAYLIDTIDSLLVRFTGTRLTEEQIIERMHWPLEKLETDRNNLVSIYNMYPLGWN